MDRGLNKQTCSVWIKEYLANLCSRPAHSIGNHTPFFELGVSSLDMVQFAKDFSSWSNLEIEVSDLFNYPNVEKLTHFATHYKDLKVEVQKTTAINLEPIAVIGLACNFPGSPSEDDYWQLLVEGKNAVTKLNGERFNHEFNFPAFSGLISNLEHFDHEHFGISKEEAKNIDPQQKLLMTLSWEALENAGMSPLSLKGSNTGVFIGLSTHDHSLEKASRHDKVSVFDGIGGAHSISANRLSYFYDFLGQSLVVDTACSSSLLSIHLACNSLKMNECDMALAGGVNAILFPSLTESFHKAGMLSPTGSCKTFSEGADGYVRSEGGGIIVLKKLSKALEDGDKILALIKGSAINQDGKTNTITAPNGLSQERVIKQAHANAQLNANDIDFIETHGTGTPLGDPIEYKALSNVFKNNEKPVFISSVKTNIGHLEAGAGIAGSIKAILSFKNKCFPKLIHFKSLNTNISNESSVVKIATENVSWEENKVPKHIGVSSFGFGGTNAHMIFEEYFAPKKVKKLELETSFPQNLCFFSSSSEQALKKTIKRFEKYLEKKPNIKLADLSYTLLTTRSKLPASCFFIASSSEELEEKIKNFDFSKTKHVVASSSMAFAFTGQGSQYPKMGIELYEYFPVFRTNFNYIVNKFQEYFAEDLFVVWKNNPENKIFRTDYGQALLFAYEYSLYKLLESISIRPQHVFGHSLGEIVAAVCAEYLSLDDGIKLIAARGKAMQKSPAGKMLSVDADEKTLQKILGDHFPEIDIAAKNTRFNLVISGTEKIISLAENILKAQNINCTMLKVEQAFHSRLMNAVVAEFEAAIKDIQYKEPKLQLISCSLGKVLVSSDLNQSYWGKHLLEVTDFASVSVRVDQLDVGTVIEIGPHAVLGPFLKNNLSHKANILASASRTQKEVETFWTLLATLHTSDVEISWDNIFNGRGLERISLPSTALADNSDQLEISQQRKTDFKNAQEVAKELKTLLQDQLALDQKEKSAFNFTQDIVNMGADSLVLLNFIESVNDLFKVDIRVDDIFSKVKTIEALSLHIFSHIGPKHTLDKPISIELAAKYKIPLNLLSYVDEIRSSDQIKNISAQDTITIDFNGNINIDNLKEVIKSTMKSHDAFYAKYDLDGKTLNFSGEAYTKISNLDISSLPDSQAAYQTWENKEKLRVLDISKEPLAISLIKLQQSIYRLHISYHRLAFDRQAILQFVESVATNYEHFPEIKNLKDHSSYESYLKTLSKQSQSFESMIKSPSLGYRLSKTFSIKKLKKTYAEDKNYSGSIQSILISHLMLGLNEVLGKKIDQVAFSITKNIIGSSSQLYSLELESLDPKMIHEKTMKAIKEHKTSTKGKAPEIVMNLSSLSRLPFLTDAVLHFSESQIFVAEFPMAVNFHFNNDEITIELDCQHDYLEQRKAELVFSKLLTELK